ncbi:MAG: DUF4169 family protein [Mesorhizobium sp.]
MAEILNLRLARKRKARAEEADKAAANRALHGMTLVEKRKLEAERKRASARLDGHWREPGQDAD